MSPAQTIQQASLHPRSERFRKKKNHGNKKRVDREFREFLDQIRISYRCWLVVRVWFVVACRLLINTHTPHQHTHINTHTLHQHTHINTHTLHQHIKPGEMSLKFTAQAMDALRDSENLVRLMKHVQYTPFHLLSSLFQKPNSLAKKIAKKLTAEVATVQTLVGRELKKVSTQSPAPESVRMNGALEKVIREANEIADKNKDTYIDAGSLLLALYAHGGCKTLLESAGLNFKAVKRVIEQLRGNKPITSAQAETTYDALEKYGYNLVEQGEEGKLDPGTSVLYVCVCVCVCVCVTCLSTY
jgi:hypothetical protein